MEGKLAKLNLRNLWVRYKRQVQLGKARGDRGKEHLYSNIAGWGLFAVPVLVCLTLFGVSCSRMVHVNNNVNGTLDRAISAPNPAIMADRLDTAITNIRDEGLTSGNTAVIGQNDSNDMAKAFVDISGYRDRARALTALDPTSTEVSTQMNDIRKGIDLARVDYAYYSWWHSLTILWAIIMIPVSIATYPVAHKFVYRPIAVWEDELSERRRRRMNGTQDA